MPHLILARFGPHHRTAADANKKKAKATAEAKEEQSTLLDDTLKCAICFDLCERPITVRGNAGLLRLVGS